MCFRAGLMISALSLAAESASAAVIVSTDDFSVRRNTGTATVQASPLHPKLNTTTNMSFDRFGIIRFDSADFGSTVTAATFQITASSNASDYAIGSATFTLWGVIDGDAQDEAVTTAGYLPNALGALFDNSADMVDSSQLVNLGSFSASTGETVNFNPASLLTFIQADTNDIVTFAITRNTQNDLNSVLLDNTSLTPPTLTIIPEPSAVMLGGIGMLSLLRRRRH